MHRSCPPSSTRKQLNVVWRQENTKWCDYCYNVNKKNAFLNRGKKSWPVSFPFGPRKWSACKLSSALPPFFFVILDKIQEARSLYENARDTQINLGRVETSAHSTHTHIHTGWCVKRWCICLCKCLIPYNAYGRRVWHVVLKFLDWRFGRKKIEGEAIPM